MLPADLLFEKLKKFLKQKGNYKRLLKHQERLYNGKDKYMGNSIDFLSVHIPKLCLKQKVHHCPMWVSLYAT